MKIQWSWQRIIAEGVVIVASILAAFAIDAWWERRTERRQAEILVTGLRQDFEASQAHVRRWAAGNGQILRQAQAFLAELEATPAGEEITAPIAWLVAAVAAPTYSPTDATFQTALSSGQLELIEDRELRSALALWRQQLADTGEDELLIREIVVHRLVPELSSQARLGRVFDFDTMTRWFGAGADTGTGETFSLRATPELEGVLAERIFYTTFVVQGLGEIEQTQAEILRLLDAAD